MQDTLYRKRCILGYDIVDGARFFAERLRLRYRLDDHAHFVRTINKKRSTCED